MTSHTNYAAQGNQAVSEFETLVQAAADYEGQAELKRDPRNASPIRGALFAAIPSLCLWVPVGLVLAWGAFKLFEKFMALGSNFLR